MLCCGGGLTAIVGLLVTQVAAINEQSRAVVSQYLDALREEDYDAAYDLLCDEEQAALSKDRFETRERSRKKINNYEVGEFDVYSESVNVRETYRDGSVEDVNYFLRADQQDARLEVCGRE